MHDEKLLKKRAFFFLATEFPGIQMPRSNNCASLNQNNLETSMLCRPTPHLPDVITLASSAE
jgi:hypothetical protein